MSTLSLITSINGIINIGRMSIGKTITFLYVLYIILKILLSYLHKSKVKKFKYISVKGVLLMMNKFSSNFVDNVEKYPIPSDASKVVVRLSLSKTNWFHVPFFYRHCLLVLFQQPLND